MRKPGAPTCYSRATVGRRWHHSLLFIFFAALLLRLAVITVGHTYRITPRRDHFQYGWEMGRIARSLALGQGFSSPTDLPTGPTAWAPPVYPYILAGVFQAFGIYSPASAWVILAFNSLFGALTCVSLHRVAESIYDVQVARAAAWTWALFPYFIYWPVRVVWETSLSAFLLSLALLLALRLRAAALRRDWVVFGLLWGLIALTNTALLSMLPFFLGWLLYPRVRRADAALGVALCLLVAGLVVSPWLVRNFNTFGKFIFVRDNLALELYVANNPGSDGLWTRRAHPGNDAEAMQRFQQLGEIAFMEEDGAKFRDFVQHHPLRFLSFTIKRAAYFWAGTPQMATIAGYDLLAFRHTAFFLASALAFAGLWLTVRNGNPVAFLLACFLLFYPLPYYLVNPFPRYKHAIEPEMALLIVYFLVQAGKVRLSPRLVETTEGSVGGQAPSLGSKAPPSLLRTAEPGVIHPRRLLVGGVHISSGA
jgi:4-amino-4-deoxy-L-arabinose transferase-like glycosyltransferase